MHAGSRRQRNPDGAPFQPGGVHGKQVAFFNASDVLSLNQNAVSVDSGVERVSSGSLGPDNPMPRPGGQEPAAKDHHAKGDGNRPDEQHDPQYGRPGGVVHLEVERRVDLDPGVASVDI